MLVAETTGAAFTLTTTGVRGLSQPKSTFKLVDGKPGFVPVPTV